MESLNLLILHSEIYMIRCFLGLVMVSVYKLPFIAALLVSMAGWLCLLGITIEKAAYNPCGRANRIAPLLVQSEYPFLQNAVLMLAGPQARPFPTGFNVTNLNLGSLRISSLQLIILLVSIVLMVGLHLIQRTKLGQAMRATAQDKETAQLMGIKIDQVISFTCHWFRIRWCRRSACRCLL